MNRKRRNLFDRIAPVYGLFYGYQIRRYQTLLGEDLKELDFSQYKNAIDVGCGTGALCAVLRQRGLQVTGVDAAENMLRTAAQKPGNDDTMFVRASVLERLPFEDNSFDLSVASFVAHGLNEKNRKTMYAEMSRITKHLVIINDYSQKRSLRVSLIECLEGGDYFHFIKTAQAEMNEAFQEARIVKVGRHGACYLCRPFDAGK